MVSTKALQFRHFLTLSAGPPDQTRPTPAADRLPGHSPQQRQWATVTSGAVEQKISKSVRMRGSSHRPMLCGQITGRRRRQSVHG